MSEQIIRNTQRPLPLQLQKPAPMCGWHQILKDEAADPSPDRVGFFSGVTAKELFARFAVGAVA